ncbi:MAG: AarF/ABC1/UbiB kinase family protein [Bacteroidia bacterium]
MISRGKRYRKVFAVLIRHGFSDIVDQISGRKLSKFFRANRSKEQEQQRLNDRWIRLRLVLEELGPTYIKLGQVLSNRPGLIPDELVAELSKLQDAVPPFTYEEVTKAFIQDFGKIPEEMFKSIDVKPIASASIAQVHVAYLLTGEKVAVKVQRPEIRNIIKADIEVLKDIASLMMRSEELSSLRPKELVGAFERSIISELNFTEEAKHLSRFEEKFSDDPLVKIPHSYPDFCSNLILTMEYVEGTKISNLEKLKSEGHDLASLARKGFDAYFKQIFEWGYFHADPHPGNLLILPDHSLGILDFGMVGRISQKDRKALIEFIIGLGRDDASRIVENVEKLQGSEVEDKPALEKDMSAFIEEFGTQAVKDIDLNSAIVRGRELINKHKLKLNPDLFLLLRTVSMLEGIGTTLDPDFKSLDVIKPYAFKLIRKQLNPANLLKSKGLIAGLGDLIALASSLPSDTRKILTKLSNDKFKIQIENRGTDELSKSIGQSSKTIAYSILAAAFFAGVCFFSIQAFPIFVLGLSLPLFLSLIALIITLIAIYRNSSSKK